MKWKDLPSVEFGTIGEDIVEDIMKKRGWHDVLNKGDNPSAVDFVFVNDDKQIEIAEVKTYKTAYSTGWRPFGYAVTCTAFFRNYQPIIKAKLGVPFKLYCVDACAGMVFVADFDKLEERTFVSGANGTNEFYPDNERHPFSFPFEVQASWGSYMRYYAVQQFKPFFDFRETALQKHLSDFAATLKFKKWAGSYDDAGWIIDAETVIDEVRALLPAKEQCNVTEG